MYVYFDFSFRLLHISVRTFDGVHTLDQDLFLRVSLVGESLCIIPLDQLGWDQGH